MEARKLRSRLSSVCNPYVKISLVPDREERTFCRTPLVRATNAPDFDQKFSFDFLPEDLEKRLLVSVWNRDILRRRSEFLGCMSFSVAHITTRRVHGWFRLLTETLGRRKHFAVSFLNASHETTRTTMEEVVILDDDPPAPSTSVALSDAQGVAGSKHLPPGQTPYTISITVVRGNQGFGFSVAWTKPPRVERVEEGLPADQAGLKPGDYIIFVSHYNVVKFDEDSVLDIIRECGDTLPLEVYRRGVSKHPRGLPNGYTGRTTLTENESHPRKRLSHISFNTESASADRQTIIFALINCEQAFSHACRFGLERYLIPLKFRSDLITQSQHRALFNNMDQLMDLSENLVDRLMGSDEDTIGDHVGGVYYQLIEELAEHYDNYLGGLPEADKVLSLKLLDMDFKDFLLVPTVPRKKPDITTFIHKPAEHLREVLGLLTQVYTSSPGHPDNTYLDTVLHRLKSCYRGMTSQQNIMEPSPPAHLPTGLFGMTPSPSSIRSSTPLRPPLVSVSDIEQRLVFTKFTQPFRLNDTWRQWVFGGELYKFEGRHLKQYWAMLFTDLLLFTKINRDRVIFVMEDPVPLTGVCQALFNIKKKATEFRLIVDTRVRVSGAGSGYLTTSKSQRMANKNSVSGRSHKKTMVLRAPTIDLKATWNNLIHRQLYICQQQQQQQQLAGSPRHHAPSLARAVSSDGLHSLPLARGRFSSSVGDLRRGGRQEEEIVLDLGDDRTRGSTTSLFRSSKVRLRSSGECEEEIDLNLENEPVQPPPSAPATSAAPVATASRVSHRRPVAAPPPPAELQPGEVHLVIQDEDPARSSSRRFRSSRPSKVRRGGGKAVEEIVLNLDDDEVQTAPIPQNARSSRVNSALVNGSQEPPADVALDQNVENAAKDSTDNGYDEEVEDDIVIQDEKTGIQTRIDSKKGKGIGGKVKDKLFPNRHLPKKKKMNRVKKVEKFVDSIVVEDLNHHGRVTPVFVDEEDLTPDDFAQKRKHILQNRPRNYIEGEEEIITLDVSSPSTSHLSPMRAELMMAEERRKLAQKKKEEKRIAMRLEGIEEESLERSSSLGHEEPRKTVLSPEDYEDYIGDAVEKDYPELAGGSEAPPPQRSDSQEREELPSEEPQQFEQEQLIENQKQLIEEQKHVIEMQKQLIEEKEQQDQVQQPQPTGPLSGSASMNFMDDHSPTSNGNGDYFHRCVAKYPRDPPRQACGSFSVEANYLLTSEVDIRNETCRSIPETSLLNNNESINSFSTHFRTSCVASNDCVSGNSRKPKRTTSVSSSTSASVTESRNNSTSASEHSSMSISTGSVSSNLSNANKNRSSLFLPTSTTSLPEISIEPPTPQAPKPKDSFDRENKIMYDLRVPGYRSMFLTVPGFDDDDCDRYLPKYDLDSDDEEHSSDDDDVVHKPRVFASLAGTAESRGLKRYGSSCDIAKLVNSTAEPIYPHDDDPNGNFEFNVRKSKIGGTGSGPFVARKLEMFEKVVEEEHQKFIECQEVRKRIFRAPKKSGEYIEKFYSPQVIETIDVRATEKSRSLRYYDDEYDSFDNPRSPTPTELKTPYGGHSSPQMATSNYSSRPSCSSLYSGTIYDPPRSPSPARDYPATSYADDVFDTYDFVRGHPRSPSPPPTDSRKGVRVCSPIPEMTVDSEVIYSQPSMFRDSECSETMISGPSRSPPPNTRDNLEQRTDEVLEMLDNSFLDTLPEDDGPNHYAAMSKRHDENAEEGAVAGYNVGNSVYDTKEEPTRVASPLPDLRVTPDPDPLDDVFEIEDYDSQGSTTSLRGGHRRRAAPPPPPPPEEAGPSSSSSDKRGGFFGRVRRERDKDKDKEKKDKEKKDKEKEKKEKKEKEKERKEREKKEKENKDKDKDKAAGKRFQLFGGAKKASEPNAAEETSTKPPKKDKGKRRLFGRGKENFIGCSAHISHESDPQVARMAGDSFDRESIDLQEDSEFL
ncbi:uncharacterized protein [Panulirus ornatus]|uniref:uncharacterized protein isoform X2 n=1 Tax=Panulirus ornatus TaxID=150431 RepID=UPI003A877A71